MLEGLTKNCLQRTGAEHGLLVRGTMSNMPFASNTFRLVQGIRAPSPLIAGRIFGQSVSRESFRVLGSGGTIRIFSMSGGEQCGCRTCRRLRSLELWDAGSLAMESSRSDAVVLCSRCNHRNAPEAEHCRECKRLLDGLGPVEREWRVSSGTEAELLAFLAGGVPPSGAQFGFADWQECAKAFGGFAPPVMLWALKHGDEEQQYAALVAIRLYGLEAWGVGSGSIRAYKVRARGQQDFDVVRPERAATPLDEV